MIRFEEEDSDPYTHIVIYENDEVKSGIVGAFSLGHFKSWLKSRTFPHSVKEAELLLEEYDALTKKQTHEYTQNILSERRREETKNYSERYNELKNQGYDESKIHSKLFPEEYDFMLDDHIDAKLRSQGGNPMREDYIAKVNARRSAGGFLPLGSSGSCGKEQTMAWCKSQELKASKHQISELKDQDQASELLSPEKAASMHILRTGSCLDLGRLIKLNLFGASGYAAKKLIQIGIVYENCCSQDHYDPLFKFRDTDGTLIFITQDIERANAFVEALKRNEEASI